jgi:uncharacterized protein YaeQ
MGFVEGFYTFQVELTAPDSGVYVKIRKKLARHPDESDRRIVARMLSYCHCYTDELELTRDLFDAGEPTLIQRDVTGNVEIWAQLGCPDLKKLKKALRAGDRCDYRVFFYSPKQVDQFCQYMKGSKSNWIERCRFFQYDQAALEDLAETLELKNSWSVTLVDNTIYLGSHERTFEITLNPLDMWQLYQEVVGNLDSKRTAP